MRLSGTAGSSFWNASTGAGGGVGGLGGGAGGHSESVAGNHSMSQ